MRASLSILLFVLSLMPLSAYGYSDPSQPGIFRAGGITGLRPLYAGDSLACRKVQILNEKVAIQIYRGFAVAKSEYRLLNTSGDTINVKVGFPVNASVSVEKNGAATSVFFDPLYALKSYTNGKENMVARLPADSLQPMDDNNWYAWTDSIKPKDTSIVTVYFIVNTNNAEITDGTKHDARNIFVYFMETGAVWKQPVLNGEVKIALMDNLKITDVQGLLPVSNFKADEERHILDWQFSNISSSPDNNIVLVYTPDLATFDFNYVSQKRLALFGSVDAFFQQSTSDLKLTAHTFDSPYQVKKVKWTSLLHLGLLSAGAIFGAILLVWLIRLLVRYMKQQRAMRNN